LHVQCAEESDDRQARDPEISDMSALIPNQEPSVAQDPAPDKIRVLIADDHPLIIAGIRRTIESLDDIEVVGEAHSGPELMLLAERRRPSAVLMDLRMPGVLGVECVEALCQTYPGLKVVVLSANEDRPTIDAALHAGASAYVLKSAHTIDIASVLRQASSGAVFHAPLVPASVTESRSGPTLPALTDREREILSAAAGGLTTAEISRHLWVSEHTVKFHLTNIYRKLGVANRASAVRYALENGVVS
jgi:DNA-binding NarL/FixJ family response regulator